MHPTRPHDELMSFVVPRVIRSAPNDPKTKPNDAAGHGCQRRADRRRSGSFWLSACASRPLSALGCGLFAAALLSAAAQAAQSSVSLAWNADSGNNIAGYNLYYGVASHNYTTKVTTGHSTNASVSNLAVGTTYFFAVTAYDTSGLESDYSGEISYTVPTSTGSPPAIVSFAATSGTITAPFTVLNGTVLQTILSTLLNGGSAVYNFNITKAGNYCVSALVNAPSTSQDTCYVNIDAQPTDPLMIWDIPVTSSFANRVVSWRGNGNGNPANDQYSPKTFSLAAGSHQLIVRGQDPNVALKTFYIYAAPPNLQPTRGTGSQMVLHASGQPSQVYDVLMSPDLSTWTAIGTVTLDASGAAQFTDSGASSTANRFYRLRQH